MNPASKRRPQAAILISVIALVAALGGSATATSWKHIDLRSEAFTKVGDPSAPPFGDGGQGDCLWDGPGAGIQVSGLNPAAFYRDLLGSVHLVGVSSQTNGAGGDGFCGGDDALEDAVVFVLPPGYRPENVEIVGGAQLEALVIPDEGATVAGTKVPPGAVLAVGGFGLTVLDGTEFRAAGPGTSPISSDPVKVPSVGDLKRALR